MSVFFILFHILGSEPSPLIDISISGNYFFSDRYLLQDRTIRNLDEADIFIRHILIIYNNAGFPFCEIRPAMEKDGNRITKIFLNIDEGDRVVIAEHIFIPDKNTYPGAIRRFVHAKQNNYFSARDIQLIRQKLLRTQAFKHVEENIAYQNDRYYVLWRVHEQQTDFINAYGSISDDNYIFSITLHSINLLGTLRQLEFLYEYEKLFSIQITEPVLLAPTSIQARISLLTYDTLQLFELNGIVSSPLGQWFDISILSGIERASYGDSSVEARTNTILGGGLAAHVTHTWFETKHSIILDYLVRTNERWRVIYDGSITAFDFSIQPHGRYVFTDSLLFFDYYRLGGARSLRGYFEEDIIATKALWVNLEYKRFFAFPLVDIGYINNTVLYSYGFGIEARSSFAHAAFIVAWPKNGSWRDGILHLAFEKGF